MRLKRSIPVTWTISSLLVILMYMACESDSDSRTDDPGFTSCTEPRPEVCTLDINPVCGFRIDGSTRTYDNGCNACSDFDVDVYRPGECPVIACTDPRPQACTREYDLVCGLRDDGASQTYATGCEACADVRVVSYQWGVCPS